MKTHATHNFSIFSKNIIKDVFFAFFITVSIFSYSNSDKITFFFNTPSESEVKVQAFKGKIAIDPWQDISFFGSASVPAPIPNPTLTSPSSIRPYVVNDVHRDGVKAVVRPNMAQ